VDKVIITYGTFDLFHHGHERILRRAKKEGTRLIVGVTSSNYDQSRGKLNVVQSLAERIKNVEDSHLADEIFIEDYAGQKIDDIKKYKAAVFVIGDDWLGKFDYLSPHCKVLYLERTKDISSTQIRGEKFEILNIGIAGTGAIAKRIISESKYVSGINMSGVFSHSKERAKKFADTYELEYYEDNYAAFLNSCDAVYIASIYEHHFQQAKDALNCGKHVLIEKPAVLNIEEMRILHAIAKEKGLVFLEAIKTAFSPAFIKLIELCKSGVIGEIVDVNASFTKLISDEERGAYKSKKFGAFNELSSYGLLPIVKLLGKAKEERFECIKEDGFDIYSKAHLTFEKGFATVTCGLKVKREGDLVIAGTKGYVYVPAPWWKTEKFEVRYEDTGANKHYFYNFEEDGLRYELSHFGKLIKSGGIDSLHLSYEDSLLISQTITNFNSFMKIGE